MGLHLSIAIVACISSREKRISLSRSFPSTVQHAFRRLWRLSCSQSIEYRWLFISCVMAIVWIAFFNLCRPGPMNADAIAYYLPRIYFYLSQSSLYPFPTADPRQIYFPFIVELQLLWCILFTGSFYFHYMLQWLVISLTGVALYHTSCSITRSEKTAFFPVILWVSTPAVLYFALYEKNDLFLTFFVASAVAFLVALRNPRASIMGIALSLGLAFGTKYNSVCPICGIVCGLICKLLVLYRSRLQAFIASVATMLSCTLLGGYAYAVTYIEEGHIIPPSFGVGTPSCDMRSVTLNLTRLVVELSDQIYLIPEVSRRLFHVDLPDPRQPVLWVVGKVPLFDVYSSIGTWNWKRTSFAPGTGLYPDMSLAVLLLFFVSLFVVYRKYRYFDVCVMLIAFSVSVVLEAAVLPWQIGIRNFRFYLPSLVILYPLLCFSEEWIRRRGVTLRSLVALSLVAGVMVPCYINGVYIRKYMGLSFPEFSLMWARYPEDRAVIKYISNIPEGFGAGLRAGVGWEYYVMGRDFRRYVKPLPLMRDSEELIDVFRNDKRLSLVFVDSKVTKNVNSYDFDYVSDDIAVFWRSAIERGSSRGAGCF